MFSGHLTHWRRWWPDRDGWGRPLHSSRTFPALVAHRSTWNWVWISIILWSLFLSPTGATSLVSLELSWCVFSTAVCIGCVLSPNGHNIPNTVLRLRSTKMSWSSAYFQGAHIVVRKPVTKTRFQGLRETVTGGGFMGYSGSTAEGLPALPEILVKEIVPGWVLKGEWRWARWSRMGGIFPFLERTQRYGIIVRCIRWELQTVQYH